MAGFDQPNVLNSILSDVPAINEVLVALAKMDPSTLSALAVQMKRLAEGADGYEIQMFNGQSWASVGKLNHDAASVDGFSASQTVQANAIAVRDKDGKLAGDILGNAATASKAAALSATNPISKGGTGGTTAAKARENLVVPPKSHASSSTDYGLGTETEFGHVQSHDGADVSLTGAGGHAFSPAGAMLMQDYFASLVAGVEGDVSSVDTVLRALIAEEVEAQNTAINGKAPTNHASGETTYGMGTHEVYGHVKLSDYADLALGVNQGVAATPRALRTTVPAGTVIAFAGNPSSSPLGYLLCAGAAVSRTTYPELFSAIGTTYGAGDGSTTFNLPNLTDKFIQGSGTAGTIKNAGLPNATGLLRIRRYGNDDPTFTTVNGVFRLTEKNGGSVASMFATRDVSSYKLDSINFSMGNSNAIYGASTTVQPPAVTMRYYIKY